MSAVQVILLERVEKLGQMGDIVSVKPGFARNFLLPQGKAQRATKGNLERFEQQRAQLEAVNLERRKEAEAVAEKMDGTSVVIIRSASESGQLYGSVAARDIATAITEAGFTVTRGQILLDKPVKTLGVFDFRVRLHPEVAATVSVNVAQSQDEAKQQADRVARGEPAVITAAEADAMEAAEQAVRQAKELAAAAAANEAAEAGEDVASESEE